MEVIRMVICSATCGTANALRPETAFHDERGRKFEENVVK